MFISRGSQIARERLSHGHRRADVVDFDEPARRQKVHPDVVEGVLDDLMLGGIDPQRHERRLVHLALDPLFQLTLAISLAVLLLAIPLALTVAFRVGASLVLVFVWSSSLSLNMRFG